MDCISAVCCYFVCCGLDLLCSTDHLMRDGKFKLSYVIPTPIILLVPLTGSTVISNKMFSFPSQLQIVVKLVLFMLK